MSRVQSLLRMLDAFRPVGSEHDVVDAFRRLLTTPDPFSRMQFEPGHATASGFVVAPDLGSVLLVEHRRLRRWLQPGGHIDPEDEGPEAAARREIGEETGVLDLAPLVEGLFGIDHHPIPPRHDEPAHRHFDLKFAFVASSVELAVSAEVAAARWVPFDETGELDLDRPTVHQLGKLRSLL